MVYIQSVPPSSTPNSLAIPPDTRPERDFVLFQAISSYKDPAKTEDLQNAMKGFVSDVDNAAKAEGVYVDWKYGNYAAGWQEIWNSDVKERLKDVSMQYDPAGVFQKQVVGGWKLFD